MNKKRTWMIIGFLLLGVALRYLVMTLGHNYDFESYCVVGDLASRLRDVYSNTARYNYGPIFLCVQGLFYKISSVMPHSMTVYRIMLVGLFTLGDIGISAFLYKKYSFSSAVIFFLNPISIIITGYHNQFDNLAVLLALLASLYFNKEKKFNKKDLMFLVLMSACLMIKHLFFVIPFWILVMKGLPLMKRLVYSFVPPAFFLAGFIPFMIGNPSGVNGIITNVFRYRSFNNAPLLHFLYVRIGIPDSYFIYIFVFIMCLLGFLKRKESFQYQVMFYLLGLVAFSSAVANQYLAIPIAALCAFSLSTKYLYFFSMTIFLGLHYDGLGFLQRISASHGQTYLEQIGMVIVKRGYFFACLLIFFVILKEIVNNRKERIKFLKYL